MQPVRRTPKSIVAPAPSNADAGAAGLDACSARIRQRRRRRFDPNQTGRRLGLAIGFTAALPALLAPAPVRGVMLGMYSVPAEACSLVAAAGFTVIHSYAFEGTTFATPAEFVTGARRYLDAAGACGLHVLLGLPRAWLGQQRVEAVRGAIRELRGHPALLAWYEDEVAQHGDLDAVEFLDRIVREEDPGHGLVIEEALQSPRLLEIGKVRMFTYYPVTAKARKKQKLSALPQRFDVNRLHRPFWPVLQAFGRDLIAGYPDRDLLAPSLAELQYTLQSALIAGARGIFFYPYLHPTVYDPSKKQKGEWPFGTYVPLPRAAPEVWESVRSVARDALTLIGIIEAANPSTDRDWHPEVDPPLEARAWRTPRGFLVLAANPRYRPLALDLPTPPGVSSFRVLAGGEFTRAQSVARGHLRMQLPGPGGVALLLE